MAAVFVAPVTAAEGQVISTGSCGDSVTYTLVQNNADDAHPTYNITISGIGAMADYTDPTHAAGDLRPWKDYVNNITEIIIENGITSVGNFTFVGCSSCTSIKIGTDVVIIKGGAFYDIDSEFTVDFQNTQKLTTIGSSFRRSDGLKSITIPASVTTIERRAFRNCSNLTTVIIEQGSKLKSLGDQAFYKATNLTSIDLSGTQLETIGEATFSGTKLEDIGSLPDTVRSIGQQAFLGTKIESIDLPSGITTIAFQTFHSTGLKTVVIPSTVQSLENGAFLRCLELHTVDLSQVSDIDVTFTDSNTYPFSGIASNAIVYVKNDGVSNKLKSQSTNYHSTAITDGGIFDKEKTTFTAGTLAQPEKKGYGFLGWFTPDGTQVIGTPAVKSIYYANWTLNQTTSVEVSADKTGIVENEPVTLTVKAAVHEIESVTYKYRWYAGGTEESNFICETTEPTYTNNTQTANTDYYCKVIAIDTDNNNAESEAKTSDKVTVYIVTPSSVTPEAEATLLSNTTGDYAAQFLGKTVKLVNVSLLNAVGDFDHDTEVTFVVTDAQLGIPAGSALKYNFVVLHLNESVNPAVVELVPNEKVKPTENGLQITSKLSPFAIGYSLIPVDKPSGSPSSQGSSVWLMETQTPTPTPAATPTPSDTVPTDIPVTQPTETPDSPTPILGILAGLGVAVAVLRRR